MDKVNQSGPATIYGSSVPNNSLPTRPAELNSQYRPDDSHAADWCYAQQKNKPQSNSVVGPLMIMLVSGIHVGWGICAPQLRNQEWHLNSYMVEIMFTVCSWYVGAIVGTLLTMYIYTRFTKKGVYYFACVLAVISSGLFMGFPNHTVVLIVVRFLAGVAHGFAYITGVCHASENCVKEIRGMLLSSFHYVFIISAFTAAIIMPQGGYLDENLNVNMLLGGFCLLYSLMGLLMTPCFTYESIVYLIQRQKYADAIHNMVKLRSESAETWQIKNEFDEMKLMVAEDVRTTPFIFKDGNTRPLLLIILTKFVVVLGFNYAINMVRVDALDPIVPLEWAPMAIYTIRMIVVTVTLFIADYVGRKTLITVSGGGVAIATLVYGILYLTVSDDVLLAVPVFAFDVFASLGMMQIPDVLMSEAFPITKKIPSMMVATTIEHLLHILIILTTYDAVVKDYIVPVTFTFGSVLLVITVFLYMNLPETRVMSLRQARNEFRKKNGDTTFNREQPTHVNSYYS